MEEQGLPYKEITDLAAREQVRKVTQRGRETYFIKFSKLRVRDGFNVRNEYGDILGLASSIAATGLNTPLTVDILNNGTVYVEMGHRRFKALQLLQESGELKKIDRGGLRDGMVECFVNRSDTDELTRLLRQYSSNHQEAYSVLDIAELCQRLKSYFSKSHEEIGHSLGLSRQTVDNYIKIATEPDDIKQAIREGKLNPTAAIELMRTIKNQEERQEFVKTNERISVRDAKIGSKNPATEPDPHEFDDKEEEELKDWNAQEEAQREGAQGSDKEEAKLCERVIGNLDKINTMIANVETGLRTDIERLLEFCQKDLEIIHKYVKRKR